MNTYTYQIGENLYCNLTNRCSNRCTFCVREQSTKYEGYSLWLDKEPTAQEVISQIGDPKRYYEIVFCGYGEPTFRLDVMLEIARYVKANGGKTRLNTNGHGNEICGRDITQEIAKTIDGVNISLNAPTAKLYNAVCRPQIKNAFSALLSFAQKLKAAGGNCWFSAVDCIGAEQVQLCRTLANEAGIPLRVREMIES